MPSSEPTQATDAVVASDGGPAGSLIVVGATPPPIHGSNVMTRNLIEAVRRTGRLAGHLETGEDQRPVFTTGQLDPTNVYYGLKHVAQLARLLIRCRQASVYVPISQNRWGFTRDGIFIWLARLARRRVVIHLHGGLFGEFYEASPRFQRWLIARTIRAVSEAWVLTDAHRSIFEGLLPAERVRVLENAAEDMAPNGLRRAPRADGRVRVLYLSNLIPEKGYGDLLDAIDRLIERGAGGVDVRLVGEVRDDEAERLRRRGGGMAERDVRVEVVGPLSGERRVAEYEWADVFALPSRYPPEGQPLVLLEAMSAGLPILSTDHSGIPLTVLDGQQGLIVPPGDVEALAAALERLISDPELRQRLGAAGRERYAQRYRQASFHEAVERFLAAPAADLPPRPTELDAIEGNRRFYAEHADRYEEHEHCFADEASRRYLEDLLGRGLRLTSTTESLRILDACGGSGNVSELLARRGLASTVVDVSPEMLERWQAKARRLGIPTRVEESDIVAFLRETTERWDMIVFSSALHHLGDYVQAVELACERLAPEGILVTAFDPTIQGRLGWTLRRADYAAFLVLTHPRDLPVKLARRVSARLRPEEAAPNVGEIAERHAGTGVDDDLIHQALERRRMTVVDHHRFDYMRFKVAGLVARLLRTPTTFHFIAQRPPM